MKGLLKKIGGALTLGTAAAIAQVPEKAEAHHPGYWTRPAPAIVTHQTIGPFGGVWTHRDVIRPAPVYIQPGPIFVQPPIYVQPAPIIVQPPIYVAPPVYVYPNPIISW